MNAVKAHGLGLRAQGLGLALALLLPAGTPQGIYAQGRDAPPGPPGNVVITVTPATGQTAPPDALASIRGRVFAADTSRPLRRARVSMVSLENGLPMLTATASGDGRYEFNELPPGRYTLSVSRTGYLTLGYGQLRPFEQPKPLQVSARQRLEDVDFSLPRIGLVAGRVTDETGEPIAGARVFGMRAVFADGQRRLAEITHAESDDVGRYRLPGLMPGAYYVLATLRQNWTIVEDGAEQVIGYAPTYYPGTTDFGGARRFTIGVGEQVTNADFSMTRGRAASISGFATDFAGRPLGGETVYVSQEFSSAGSGNPIQYGSGSTLVRPDGSFTIRDLSPGEYKLTMRYVTGTGPTTHVHEVGVMRVAVNGADVPGVRIVTSRGWNIAGRVVVDGGRATPRWNRASVVGVPVAPDADLKVGGIDGSGAINSDSGQTFVLSGLFGRERVRMRLPDGWALKAVLHEGRDITDEEIEMPTGETLSNVQLVITDKLTNIVGRLADGRGTPSLDGTIIVFAAAPEKWSEPTRFVRTVRPDQQGQFQIRGLPPGEYVAVALPYVADGDWNDPMYLESIRRFGQRFTLGEGETQPLLLRLATQ